MSYNDLIRRGDAKRFAHQAIIQRGKHANAAASVDHALAALPAVDPLADPRVQALVEALDDLLEAITAEDRFGDRSLTITGPTANLKWLLETEEEARATLAEIEGGVCSSCREPLSLPSGDGCAAMINHAP